MLVLGFNGSLSLVNENRFGVKYGEMHDSAAVLIKDGRIVAAFEEERLNRIKHSNKLPLLSIDACLKKCGVSINDIDFFAIPSEESNYDSTIAEYRHMSSSFPYASARHFICDLFKKYFDAKIDKGQICFVNHHLAHAASSYYVSGFDDSLILTIDGKGDNLSGGVYEGNQHAIRTIHQFSDEKSLGHLYLEITRLLGFNNFDEYKVMGLAPYGDPGRYKEVFDNLFTLLPEGDYLIHQGLVKKFRNTTSARARNEPIGQDHKDMARGVQEAIERIVFHILEHYRTAHNARHLCLAGGVALNCTLTGKLRYAKLFEDIFVQPASHDGGIPLGAALATCYQHQHRGAKYKMHHLYLGSECPSNDTCRTIAGAWKDFISVRESNDIAGEAAQLIAGGKVIGWFQGASEYGPRALGTRSILADPRPAEYKDLINFKIKKREGFRPFAPSLLEDKVSELFELPDQNRQYPYMSFILRVKEEYRKILGAVTHVDGTARLHTVTKEANPLYYKLIEHFGALTGLPVVLNTSFNNNAEPIVDTPEQAIACFLTTDLDHLVIGNLVIEKKKIDHLHFQRLYPTVPPYIKLYTTRSNGIAGYIAGNTFNDVKYALSRELFDALAGCDGTQNFQSLLSAALNNGEDFSLLVDEIRELWSLRIISLSPESKISGSIPNRAIAEFTGHLQ